MSTSKKWSPMCLIESTLWRTTPLPRSWWNWEPSKTSLSIWNRSGSPVSTSPVSTKTKQPFTNSKTSINTQSPTDSQKKKMMMMSPTTTTISNTWESACLKQKRTTIKCSTVFPPTKPTLPSQETCPPTMLKRLGVSWSSTSTSSKTSTSTNRNSSPPTRPSKSSANNYTSWNLKTTTKKPKNLLSLLMSIPKSGSPT